MDDRVAAPDRIAKGCEIDEVTPDLLDALRVVVGRLAEVEDARVVARENQLVDDVRPDEPRPTRDDDLHSPVSSGR